MKTLTDKQKKIFIAIVIAAMMALTAFVVATEDVGAQQRTTRYERRTPAPTAMTRYRRPTPDTIGDIGAAANRTATPQARRSGSTARRSGR